MLTIAEAQQRTEFFLTAQMIEALRAVEYELPSFDAEPREVQLVDAARSRVQVRHVRGASDAAYLINSPDVVLWQATSGCAWRLPPCGKVSERKFRRPRRHGQHRHCRK